MWKPRRLTTIWVSTACYLIMKPVTSENWIGEFFRIRVGNITTEAMLLTTCFLKFQLPIPIKRLRELKHWPDLCIACVSKCVRQCRGAGRQGAGGPICDSLCAGEGGRGETLRERERERVLSNACCMPYTQHLTTFHRNSSFPLM
jgi:hypothetical protein